MGDFAQHNAEIVRLRKALEDIKAATLDGRVCDDVAWFSSIETLHDFCERTLDHVANTPADHKSET